MAVQLFYIPVNHSRLTVKNLLVFTLMIIFLLSVVVGVAHANVRKKVPDQDLYAPIYGDWYGNEEWVAFIFYRLPDCVPEEFDFFEFFSGAAFGCELTVKGFVVYKEPGDLIPKQAKLKGLGEVPIWFVQKDDYDNITADGNLLMSELLDLNDDSILIGSASFYRETLHPEGHPEMPMKNIVASGILDDGRSFHFHSVWVGSWPTSVHNHVTIIFD